MEKFIKKLTAFVLAFALFISMTPISAYISYAETLPSNEEVKTDTVTATNPAYRGLDIKTYSPKLSSESEKSSSESQTFDTVEEAGEYLKDQMIARNGTIKFTINQTYTKQLISDIFNEAVKDNGFGDSSAGDYLYANWHGYNANTSYTSSQSTVTLTMDYLSTYSQEQAVDKEVKNVLDDLNVYNEDNYHKVLAVHDYIVQNISYDYSLNNHSGYNAIVDKNVVCQGFASITCKMLKELGVGVRYITSTDHAWNIIKLGYYWYNTDNTWDENTTTSSSISYKYFLKGSNDFDDEHPRESKFTTSEFKAQFPTSTTNYSYSGQTQKSIASATVKVDDQTYTGSALTPLVSVTLNGSTLTKGTDYTVSFSDNTEIGTATVTITGIGNYTGKITANFKIVAPYVGIVSNIKYISKDANSIKLSWGSAANATAYKLYRSTSEDGYYTLILDTDSNSYTDYSLSPNTTYYYKVAAYKTVNGKTFSGNYSNVLSVTTDAELISIASASVKINDQTYTGSALTPSVSVTLNGTTLTRGTDYTVSYSNNTSIGTATVTVTGIGNYTGKVTAHFNIVAPTIGSISSINCTTKDTNSAEISWSSAYNATSYKLYRATSQNGTYSLIAITDSTSYTDYSLNPNTTYYYKVIGYKTVGGQNFYGNYSSVLPVTTDIKLVSISSATVKVSDQTFTGSALTPLVSVTLNGSTLTKGTDYTVSYSNNTSIGTATVTVTGIGNYTGKVTAYFNIVAPTIGAISSINCTTKDTNSAKISWNAASNATSYKLYRATSQNGTYSLIAITYSTSYTDYSLSPNTTYYYKVRGYKTVGGQDFYGSYSSVLPVTTDIELVSISSATVKVSDQTYTGSALTPLVSVTLNGTTLTRGTDYTVSFSNNTEIGTATVTVTGIGKYTGQAKGYFEIVAPTLNAVRGLYFEGSDTDSIEISWDYVQGATKYQVYRATNKYGDYELVSDTYDTEFTDTGLEANTTYYYKVRAYKVINSNIFYGDFSYAIEVQTEEDEEISTLNISNYNYPTKIVRGNSFTLRGTISSNYLIDYVSVQILDEYGNEVESACKEVSPYEYSFSDLDRGIKFGLLDVGNYTYRVYASDESGNEKVLIDQDFRVTAPAVSVKSITGLKYTNTTSSTKLSWTKASGVSGYEVWMYKSSLGYYTRVKTISGSSTNYYTRTNLTSATMYRYKVRAYKTVNGVKYYGKFTDEFITATKPLTPKVTATSPSTRKVKLTWTNTSSKTTGYQIYRATSKSGTYKKVGTTKSKSFTNTGLTKGKYYYYKVRAYRILDNGKTIYSSYSSIKSVKVK